MKSPKAILSENIAEVLATYFVIEPSQVETNLIKDAGVTLHNVKLQPVTQRINAHTAVDINGIVQEAGFHWNWGSSQKDGGSTYVNSAKLTISGLDFRALLRPIDEQESDLQAKTAAQQQEEKEQNGSKQTPSPKKKTGRFASYVEDQVNRIVDTLTLSITDFQFKIQISQNDSSLVFGGESIQLDSEGRIDSTDPLRQTLSLKGIFASVIEHVTSKNNDSQTFPLLQPFSYTTSCVRTSGKRFGHGITTGLKIQGPSQVLQEEAGDSSSIVMHAGTNQLQFLNVLGGYLLTAETPPPDGATTTGESSGSDNDNEEINDQSTSDDEEQSASLLLLPTMINMPLRGLALVFPNGSKISVQGLLLQYVMDGTMFKVSGHDGFDVNDAPLLDLPDSCQWEADMVSSKFRVFKDGATEKADGDMNNSTVDTVATIRAHEMHLQRVKDGMLEMVSILQGMTKEDSGAAHEVMSGNVPSVGQEQEEEKKDEEDTNKEETPSSPAWKAELDGGVDFCFLNVNNEVAADCFFHNVQADTSTMTFSLESIDKAIIPGAISLKEPVKNTTMTFDGKLLDLNMGAVVACLEEPPESQKPGNEEEELKRIESKRKEKLSTENSSSSSIDDDDDSSTPAFVLPFAAKASIESVVIYETDKKTLHTTMKAIDFAVGPDMQVENGNLTPTGGVRSMLVLEEFNHQMVQAMDPRITSVIHLDNLDKIESLNFGATSIGIAAGYSVSSWARFFETGDQNRKKKHNEDAKKKKKKPTKLPFAHVHPLKINIAVNKGKMINLVGTEGSTLHFNEFKGNEKTTSEDLFSFYTTHMISNVPGVVLNANVLGMDVGDTAATHVGAAAGAGALSTLGSAATPIASVLGMVGFDGIKGTINAGKRGRGAAADDKANFGDFFRGFGQAAKEATQHGAKRRGKTSEEKADALDWAIGATEGVGEYTSENKSRLGGAGAGAVGFAYGMLLGGPVGAVAGAVIAGTGTSASIDALDKKFKKNEKTPQIEN